MKSVVVEASTVAKAIEVAWHKAEKPEEFFIRVLQEHSSGFLGFGAQKAKIVLFFKNAHKSDSLFPVVLKQKEYANFFGNQNLKVPTQLNVVDGELNKNVSLGGQHKKKQHQQNNQQQKAKQHNQPQNQTAKTAVQPSGNKVAQPAPKAGQPMPKAEHNQVVKQIKIENKPKQQQQAFQPKVAVEKVVGNNQQGKPSHHQPKMQVSLQAPKSMPKISDYPKAIENVSIQESVQNIDKIDDAVKNIAQALKKVQSKKIIANVSKVATPKFESYEDFINATQAKAKASEVHSVTQFSEVVVEKIIVEKVVVAPQVVSEKKVEAINKVVTPRPVLKLKRRPLTTENPGVSGITRSVPKDSVNKNSINSFVEEVKADETKNEQE
ncbi:MAG: Jag N-terminal domain-containing protein [Candidatus Dependentiae bacterium]|nr:Jag N-terminal domain-containing protein [Candidatus Dependentiae bacterium]